MLLTDITEKEVQGRLIADKCGSSLTMLPNHTPSGWWENDVFQIMKSGYWVEYEIKRSLSDYRADFKKSDSWGGKVNNKHELLASDHGLYTYDPYPDGQLAGRFERSRKLPNRFYFCVPEELVDKIDPPSYAGLISYKRFGTRVALHTLRVAPLRHKIKHDHILTEAAMTGCNRYRYNFLKQNVQGYH